MYLILWIKGDVESDTITLQTTKALENTWNLRYPKIFKSLIAAKYYCLALLEHGIMWHPAIPQLKGYYAIVQQKKNGEIAIRQQLICTSVTPINEKLLADLGVKIHDVRG